MGRKSHSKQNSKKNAGKENNKFIQQKRKELAVLVDKVLRLTGIFQASNSVLKCWEHHLEIDALIKEILNLEGPQPKSSQNHRQSNIDKYIKWLNENEVQLDGIEISEFKGYEMGLKATKEFKEGSLILTIPTKLMMTEMNAKESELGSFISVDPLLQSMPNITLAMFLLLEKQNPESFWKPYIDILPDKYSTILYFTLEELAELKPSPVFESALKLYRSITRQYAYFYNKIHSSDIPVLKKLQDVFTFDSYRWAVSTVMTRQNNIQLGDNDVTAFIPLWDMCNHEQGKITTDFDKDSNQGKCYALRDFKPGEQIFIFYGARSNANLFLHNGFVYPENQHDSLALSLGVSSSDPLRETKLSLLTKLGLSNVAQFYLYKGDNPVSAELLAFIRIFNMNKEELAKWSQGMPGDLVSSDPSSAEAVGADIDRRAYTYLLTRCRLLSASYKDIVDAEDESLHRKNVKLLKKGEVQILQRAIKYLEETISKLPATEEKNKSAAGDGKPKVPIAEEKSKLPAADVKPKLPVAAVTPKLPVAAVTPKLPAAEEKNKLPETEVKPDLPAAEEKNKLPIAEVTPKLPAAEDKNKVPAAEEKNKLPAAEQKTKLPAAEVKPKSPVAEEKNKLPVTEEKNQLPAAEEKNKLPAAKQKTKLPAAEVKPKSPVAEEKNKLPVTEEKNQLPVAEEKNKLPATEEKTKLPASEVKPKLPAAEKKKKLPATEVKPKIPAVGVKTK